MKKFIILGSLGLLAISEANAGVVPGVTASASSSIGAPYDRGAGHVVDGSGTNFSTGVTSNGPDGTMWLDNGNGAYGGVADTAPFIAFNLGTLYKLTSMTVWNYNEASFADRGIASALLSTSTDGFNYTVIGPLSFNEAPGTTTSFGQTISLALTAQFVELSNFTQFAGDDSNLQGLSEVQFQGTAVPEPASLVILAAGVAGLVATRRRRRV